MTADVERLTESEAAYTRQLAEQLKTAQTVWASWSSFLAQHYQLGPEDRVDIEQMVVVRAAPEAES